jgi:hypothetical protein
MINAINVDLIYKINSVYYSSFDLTQLSDNQTTLLLNLFYALISPHSVFTSHHYLYLSGQLLFGQNCIFSYQVLVHYHMDS